MYFSVTCGLQFDELQFELRKRDSYTQHCAAVATSQDASKEYGIKSNSCLNDTR